MPPLRGAICGTRCRYSVRRGLDGQDRAAGRAALAAAASSLQQKSQNLLQRRVRITEEQTKKDFILPLFRALSWEIENPDEVVAEERASGGRVDYAFRIAGVPLLLLEAKSLKTPLDLGQHASQALTYGYNKGVAWVVLTNFTDLYVLNAEIREFDPARAVLFHLKSSEFADRVEQLELLTRQAIAAGSLDAAADQWNKRPRHRPIGTQLLTDLLEWREQFARNYKAYNPGVPQQLVSEGVQKQLDRFVFMRTAEDRQLEERRLWEALQSYRLHRSRSLRGDVESIVRYYDEVFNSKLFEHHAVDDWSSDDGPFEKAVQGLYGPSQGYTRYAFDAIGGDVLGAIYEQYLEELKTSGSSRRREQGIYYTPKWVVRFITHYAISHALSEIPEERRGDLQVLDMACGSGSFLVAALDAMHEALDPETFRSPQATLLGLERRLTLLKNNIHGLDLDPQAVEIAQLNLLLSVLNHRTRLPDLRANVTRGNALVDGSTEELKRHFGDDWRDTAPHHFDRQYDVIIGNPPYIKIQTLPAAERDYYKERYGAVATGSFDIFTLFVARAVELLKDGGYLGFIVPVRLLQADYGLALLRELEGRLALRVVLDLRDIQVFADAQTYPVIVVFQKSAPGDRPIDYYKVPEPPASSELTVPQDFLVSGLSSFEHIRTDASAATRGHWPPVPRPRPLTATPLERDALLPEITADHPSLMNWRPGIRVYQGLITGKDEVFIVDAVGPVDDGVTTVRSEADGELHEIESGILHALIKPDDVVGSAIAPTTRRILMPYNTDGSLLTIEELNDRFPRALRYLRRVETVLREREKHRFDNEEWYQFSRTQNIALNVRAKLVMPYVVEHLRVAIDVDGAYCINNIGVGGIYLGPDASPEEYWFLAALLRSDVPDTIFRLRAVRFGGGYYSANRQFLLDLPVPAFEDVPARLRARIVALSRELHEEDTRFIGLAAGGSNERTETRRRQAGIVEELSALAYDAYELPYPYRLKLADVATAAPSWTRGRLWSAEEVARHLRVEPDEVMRLVEQGRVVRLDDRKESGFPEDQFTEDGVVEGLDALLRAVPTSHPLIASLVVVSPDGRLGGRSPLQALRMGERDAAIRLVSDYGHHGTS